MLISSLQTYVAEEGGPHQELGYAFQFVEKSSAQLILDEMKKFKKWVQSIASQRTDQDLVPFKLITFAKKMDQRDFL
jgi:hypothetical protein